MRKRFDVAVVFAIAIMITIPFNGFILPSTAEALQQRINTNTSSSQSTNFSNALPLNTIFKEVENSVVQITSKIPTTGVPNPQNPPSSNATTLGSGFVYDKQGHIVTNDHVVGGAKIVDVTFVDGNRYPAIVIAAIPIMTWPFYNYFFH